MKRTELINKLEELKTLAFAAGKLEAEGKPHDSAVNIVASSRALVAIVFAFDELGELGELKCTDCIHSDKLPIVEPCKTCIQFHNGSNWEPENNGVIDVTEAFCRTCLHCDADDSAYPCSTCRNLLSKWEPVE